MKDLHVEGEGRREKGELTATGLEERVCVVARSGVEADGSLAVGGAGNRGLRPLYVVIRWVVRSTVTESERVKGPTTAPLASHSMVKYSQVRLVGVTVTRRNP